MLLQLFIWTMLCRLYLMYVNMPWEKWKSLVCKSSEWQAGRVYDFCTVQVLPDVCLCQASSLYHESIHMVRKSRTSAHYRNWLLCVAEIKWLNAKHRQCLEPALQYFLLLHFGSQWMTLVVTTACCATTTENRKERKQTIAVALQNKTKLYIL